MQDASRDLITPRDAGTLPGLFAERVKRTPSATAYRSYDALNATWMDTSWQEMAIAASRWERALAAEKLQPGDRVAIMARNSRMWVMFDQAALALGLVVVPVYTEDRGDNVRYILEHSGASLLVIGGPPQWDRLRGKLKGLPGLRRLVSIAPCHEHGDRRLRNLDEWLDAGVEVGRRAVLSPGDLATIVYTSGTTGRPKGVMLSHRNILSNVYSCARTGLADGSRLFLSFLPLSHTFERTVGYYLPIALGATVAHSRSIQDLAEDLQVLRPEGLISVPRIFERVYNRLHENLADKSPFARGMFRLAVHVGWQRFEHGHGRAGWSPLFWLWPLLKRLVAEKVMARLGGRVKVAISGGAALAPEISRLFVGLGFPVYQGYGLTETSPVVSVNTREHNRPATIGQVLPDVEVSIGEDDELRVRGQSVMMGYWKDEAATAKVIDPEGWLHTGDKARISDGYISITGRLKDIIVLANGEKVSPVDMESAIITDPLFEQVMIIGESKPFLSALVVLERREWSRVAAAANLDNEDMHGEVVEQFLLERLSARLNDFPGYARVYGIVVINEPWTVENDMLTPTLKMRRNRILQAFADDIERIYAGRSV